MKGLSPHKESNLVVDYMGIPAHFKFAYVILLSLLSLPAFAYHSNEPCQREVPPDLDKILTQQFPSFRLPRLTDHSSDTISYDRKNGGDGCLSVVTSDFDGDNNSDVAILLPDNENTTVQLVAALRRENSWAIYYLSTWCKKIAYCYVKKLEPGLYERTPSIDGPVSNPDERERIQSITTSIVSGTLESTGVAYVFSGGKWLHVWVSD